MTNFSHYPLQKAIYQRLIGDATLMSLVEGIYDHLPQDTPYPYVMLGEATGSDWSSKTSLGMEYVLTLDVWSREGGRKKVFQIMEQIYQLLHNSSFVVEGQTLVLLRFLSSQASLESDGWTYRGAMRLRALLETAS